MGSLRGPDKNGSFELTYGGDECPFTGLDTTAAAPYIGAGALSNGTNNVLPTNKQLVPVSLNQSGILLTLTATQTFLGIGDLNNQQFAVIYDSTERSVTVYFDTSGGASLPVFSNSASVGIPLMAYTPNPLTGSLTYKNVNGICYFSFVYCPYILLHDNLQVAVLTSYLGCAYLNELKGRLVAANIFQVPQAPPNTTDATTPATETVTAINTRFNTVTVRGTPMFFPSVAIPGGGSVTVQVNFNWNVIDNFPGGDNPNSYYGGAQVQYSLDTGSTWQTPYQANSPPHANYNSGNLSITLTPDLFTSLTNLNTLAVRINVSASGADLPNIVTTTGNITQATASIVNTPLTPVFSVSPFQFAWCAALQQYGIWNPIAPTGFASGAGYNNLPDVEDLITGLIMEGPTGYIIREQGITEVTALNSGIQPFDFNHLWASHLGVGSNYSYGTCQYGALGFILANDDIYTVGYSGINVIAGKAKSAIYSMLISLYALNPNYLYTAAGLFSIDGDVSPVFVLVAAYSNSLPQIFIYWQATGEWYFLEPSNIPDTGSPNVLIPAAFNILSGFQIADVNRLTFNWVSGVDVYQFTLPTTSSTLVLPAGPANFSPIVFKGEEILFLRDITIDGIGIYFKCLQIGIAEGVNVVFSITGLSNGQSVTVTDSLNSTNVTTAGYQYAKLYPLTSDGKQFTGQTPQLSIYIDNTNDATEFVPIIITKVVLFGSIDVTQRPL